MHKNTLYSIRLNICILLIIFLAYDFAKVIYFPTDYLKCVPYSLRMDIYFSYFTTQSNYITIGHLFFSLIYTKTYKKKTPLAVDLAVTIYITLTMIVFWSTLITVNDGGGAFSGSTLVDWLNTTILHLFTPLIMISTFVYNCGKNYYSVPSHNRLTIYAITCYPVIYLIYQLVRGVLRIQEFGSGYISNNYWYVKDLNGNYIIQSIWYHLDIYGKKIINVGGVKNANIFSYNLWASYFFFNLYKFRYSLKVKNLDGTWNRTYWDGFREVKHKHWFEFNDTPIAQIWIFFIICCLVIGILTIFLQFFYIKLNNKKYYKFYNISDKLYSKEELKIIAINKKYNPKYINQIFYRNKIFKKMWVKKYIRKFYANLKKEDRKYEYLKQKKEFDKVILERKNKLKEYKFIRKMTNKNLKQILLNIPYLDRSFVKENLKEGLFFQKIYLKWRLVSIDANCYDYLNLFEKSIK